MHLLEAKTTRVQNSIILGSAKVFKMHSIPIPLRSPEVIPIIGFCGAVIILYNIDNKGSNFEGHVYVEKIIRTAFFER